MVAGEVVSLQEEEQGTEMTISGAAETLVEVEAMVEMTLLEHVSFQGAVGVEEDEVVKVTNKEEGEVAQARFLLQHSLAGEVLGGKF